MRVGYAFTLALLCGVAMCWGCATPSGKWSLRTTDPSAMRASFRPHELTLQKDGTYFADTNYQVRTGVWSWDGSPSNGLLVLDERGGTSESYKASMRNNRELVLQTDVDGRPVKGTYGRTK